MTLKQSLLFVMYYTIFQAVLAGAAGLALRYLAGLHVTWRGVALLFGLLACCGPVFAALVYWSRAARSRIWACATRFGISISVIVGFYATAVALSARGMGLSPISSEALGTYIGTLLLLGTPIAILTTYSMLRWRGHSYPRELSSGRFPTRRRE